MVSVEELVPSFQRPKGCKGKYAAWLPPPSDPPDLFAIAAILMARSGAYHHVQESIEPKQSSATPRVLRVCEKRRRVARASGAWWRSHFHGKSNHYDLTLMPPFSVRLAWRAVLDAAGISKTGAFIPDSVPVFQELARDAEPPSWWMAALMLLMIADEASADIGFLDANAERSDVLFRLFMTIKHLEDPKEDHKRYTLSHANPDVICVLPKSRTPSLGCTMRSMSHHLAALPPQGLARARWIAPLWSANDDPRANKPLNLLLVPYPYSVSSKDFRSISAGGFSSPRPAQARFSARPGVEAPTKDLDAFVFFVNDLINRAEADLGEIHGLVFPELALSARIFKRVLDDCRANRPNMEMLAAGLHEMVDEKADGRSEAREGNWSALVVFGKNTAGSQVRAAVRDIREKHHRWVLTQEQIATYSLGAALDASQTWAEALDIFSRSLSVVTLRNHLTVTTLICEDLARVDPAQELVRAIGPNLILALLMDGPQLQTRWPGRYAGVLAEDPGSSVLTFTSLGLIERTNATRLFEQSRCIGLWRDDRGAKGIHIPPDYHAIALSLTAHKIEEYTLDGRSDGVNAEMLRLSGIVPIKSSQPTPAWIR